MTQKEFDALARNLRPGIVLLAERFSSATSLAEEPEDIAQETLTTLWDLTVKGYPVRDAKALSHRIAKNLCVSKSRKRRIPTLPLSGDNYSGGSPATETLDAKENSRLRETLLGGLSKTQRNLLSLRGDLGLSLDEIAAVTGKPKSSVKTSISAARKQMLEQIKKLL